MNAERALARRSAPQGAPDAPPSSSLPLTLHFACLESDDFLFLSRWFENIWRRITTLEPSVEVPTAFHVPATLDQISVGLRILTTSILFFSGEFLRDDPSLGAAHGFACQLERSRSRGSCRLPQHDAAVA